LEILKRGSRRMGREGEEMEGEETGEGLRDCPRR